MNLRVGQKVTMVIDAPTYDKGTVKERRSMVVSGIYPNVICFKDKKGLIHSYTHWEVYRMQKGGILKT